MPAVSKKQQQFFGIVRAIQKGEQAPTTPETAKAAADMKKSDVKKFASTKHKGLPNKVVQKEESNPRIPRKKGQPAGSKKHSDLYTDENPKGTIHGLGFKDVAKAKASVSKIRNSSRSHAHKIQAAVAMEQRAREMGKTSEAAVYRKFINMMKKKTKKMNEEVKRDEYGDPVGGPKISKKQKAKNLAKNTPDEQHTTTTSEAANPAQQAAIAINMKKKGKKPKDMNEEGLRAWFGKSKSKDGKPGWVQVVSGKPCARSPGQKSAPKCVSSAKRASMTDAERKSAQRRKRAADPNQAQKSGAAKPTYVSTDPKKKKVSEAMNFSKFKSRAMDAAKKAVAKKSSSEYVGKRDAGAIAAKKMRDKEQQKYVGFLPANEGMSYGLYKGSGKPSGAMAAFAKKDKEKKKEVKKEAVKVVDEGKKPFPTEKVDRKLSSLDKKMASKSYGYKRSDERNRSMKISGIKDAVKRGEDPRADTRGGAYAKQGNPPEDHRDAYSSNKRKRTVKPAGVRKEGLTMMILGKEVELKEKCWKGYEKKGMKTMFGKRYPNCVKKEEVEIEEKKMVKVKLNPEKKIGVKVTDIGPGGKEVVRKNTMDEAAEVVTEVKDKKGKGSGTKDACYHKVKSRYSVWPSAYASGALVKCRKVGAANWGNSSKKEQFSDWKSEFIWEDGDSEKKPVDESFGGSSTGDRAARGDEVGRRERVKRAQEAKAKRQAVKDTPIDKYKPSPAMARYLAKSKEKKEGIGSKIKRRLGLNKEEFVSEDDMKGMSVKSGHKRPTKSGAGMTQKGVEAYRRRNPGSKLKTAVTTKPSKLKKGSKAANRRKSYCARSAGQMKKFPKAAKDPNSRLRQARRRWNC